MSGSLLIRNRQRAISLDSKLFRDITTTVVRELLKLEDFDLAIHIIRAPEITQLNEIYLRHKGSTDVITFDYSDPTFPVSPAPPLLHGEIFISVDDVITQAREFGTSWQSELVRYTIHGILHLRGFDDLHPSARRKMKREENRLLKEVLRLFP